MANSIVIAYRGKKILSALNGSDQETKRIIKVMNFYKFSPMFLLFGGYCVKKQLVKKNRVREDCSLCDYVMSLYTLLFCDELIIILTIITTILLLNKYWIEPNKTIAFYEGYQEYKNSRDASYISCHEKSDTVCFFCDQAVKTSVIDNNATYVIVDHKWGCVNVPAVHCPRIQNISVNMVKSHAATKTYDFTDYQIYDDVYFIYNSYIKKGNMIWQIVSCNKVMQGNSRIHDETTKYNLYIALTIAAIILFYLIIHAVTSCLYNRINVDECYESNLLI
jgi:hypothetical protein